MDIIKSFTPDHVDFGLAGKFTYQDHGVFKEVISAIAEHNSAMVILDMKDLKFIDSAGLGMMLLAHDEAARCGKQITITGLSGQVEKMFDMTRMNRIFEVR